MFGKKKDERTVQLDSKKLDFYANANKLEVVLDLKSTVNGITAEEAEERLEEYGENKVSQEKEETVLHRLLMSFVDPFTGVLLTLAGVSFVTDVWMAPKGEGDPATVIIIITMVLLSGIMHFVQEMRSSNAAEKLNELVETTTCVVRIGDDGKEIPLEEVVIGDIVKLAAGDIIPADLRIIQARDLFISQASLTGESEPVEKYSEKPEDDEAENYLEASTLAFMGSDVISGSAVGVVVGVGSNTVFGQVAKTLANKRPDTGFQLGVKSLSWLLIKFMLVTVPIVFFINGFTKNDWAGAFLFGLSIAVGLTPEMLPMIVTTSLAKGAQSMAKKKTIVKNLQSIQSFGAMDILCTDKTGTLTKDKVELQYHLDVLGHENQRILGHAFINSYFQTGLKNLLDVAIIEKAQELGADVIKERYKKVDEIPFDFQRRRMSVVVEHSEKGHTKLMTKGAVEEMITICSHVEYKGEVVELTEALKKEILKTVDDLNDQGMRVLALAQKTNPPGVGEFSVEDESDMVLLGYLAFLDPVKESTIDAIKALKDHGVDVKVLTGDNDRVTRSVCSQVGLDVSHIVLGSEFDAMDEEQKNKAIAENSVFAKLSPTQKERIVHMLRQQGHIVGHMGDGINDAPAMRASDVGISVDTAVDIAKESADIVLLEKDLMVLEEGIIEGRITFANMMKYIKITASSNFGNIFSILLASAFLPFLPMQAIQLVVLSLIYDITCIAIPWDNVDKEYLQKPRDWNSKSIRDFMIYIGPVSSIFDILTYVVMYFVICPAVLGGGYHEVANQTAFVLLFQTGWFVISLWTQTLVIHFIRTEKKAFKESRSSWPLMLMGAAGLLVGTVLPFTSIGKALEMVALPSQFFIFLPIVVILYIVTITIAKRLLIKRDGEFL